jgi:hypothetical protein
MIRALQVGQELLDERWIVQGMSPLIVRTSDFCLDIIAHRAYCLDAK